MHLGLRHLGLSSYAYSTHSVPPGNCLRVLTVCFADGAEGYMKPDGTLLCPVSPVDVVLLDNTELVLGVRCLIPAQSHHSLTNITHEAIVKHGMHALSDCPRCWKCLLFAFNVSLACLDSVASCSFGAVPFLMFSASVFLSDSTSCKGSFQS